jgi:thioredoxin reductase
MHFDAIVIGGSFAGLSAAINLARARRTVCVIDAGQPRNRFADHSHGFFGQDGANPLDMIAAARAKVLAYPTVSLVEDTAVSAQRVTSDRFDVELSSGETLSSTRLVLAHGVTDQLPEIPGLAERWGKTVLHCPYCHGYEVAGERLGILSGATPLVEHTRLIAEWGPATLFLNGNTGLSEEGFAELAARGIAVEPAPIVSLSGEGTALASIRLADGREVKISALFIPPTTHLSPLVEQLGCETEPGPAGLWVKTDAMKMTTVPGVFAAGDIRGAMNASLAAADGVMAGVAAHRSLVFGLPE